jgi:predicted metal-dependent peptidase
MHNNDMNLPVETKIVKARIGLQTRDPFLGAIAIRLHVKALTPEQVMSSRIRTVATDSVYLIHNPEFIERLAIVQLVAVIAHEGLHIVFKHPLRRNGRHIGMWNTACDFAINPILIEAGYELPAGRFNPDYKGMAAETIYAILKKEHDLKIQTLMNTLSAANIDPHFDPNLDPGILDPGNFDPNNPNLDPDFEALNLGSPDPDSNDPDDTGLQYDPDDHSHDTKYDDEFGLPEDFFGKNSDPSLMPTLPDDMDDFEGGVILDAPLLDGKPDNKAERRLDHEVSAAAIAADLEGKLPEGLKRLLTARNKHQVSYRDAFRDWMERNLSAANYSWKKPNRRYSKSDLIMPSIDSEFDMPKIVVAIDASTSVTDRELEIYSDELSGVLAEFDCIFTAIFFSDGIRDVVEFTAADLPIKLEIKAGGCTYFKPVFDYIKENQIAANGLAFFTDMGAFDWDELAEIYPEIPVLWMNTDRREDEREVPFGNIIPLDLDPHGEYREYKSLNQQTTNI